MKRTVFVILFLLLYPVWPVPGQQPGRMKLTIQGGVPRQPTMDNKEQPGQPLTNESILKLVKAGLGEDTVISMVNTQPGKYSLGVDDIIALKTAGVSEKIIHAMLNKPSSRAGGGTAEASGTPPVTNQQVASPRTLKLEDGTPVKIRLQRTLSSADAQTDDKVDFDVLEEVKVDDVLVIPKGSVAWGTVTAAQAKRRMSRGGKIDVNIDAVRLADGEKAALRGVKDVKGGGHTGAMTGAIVATSLVLLPAAPFFLFMHGKDITIPKGTELTVFINGDMNLDLAKFTGLKQRE
jgi:hypothetical protein